MNELATASPSLPALFAPATVPAVIAATGDAGIKRYVEFFTANIRNKNTRGAYFRACTRFFEWLAALSIDLDKLEPVIVAAYIEQLSNEVGVTTVKQHLAALRMLFDYLVVGQVMTFNPAAGVRGPKHVVREGKTPILKGDDARALFESIDGDRPIDYRDRALIGLMIYSFARISAALSLQVKDFKRNRSQAYFRLNEKGGVVKDVPAHHQVAILIEDYLDMAGIREQLNTPLFRSSGRGRGGSLTERGINRSEAWHMVKRRASVAGLSPDLCNHSFRGTGITLFLENGGDLEMAAWIANHASTKTTKLYDRRRQEVTQGEIERVKF